MQSVKAECGSCGGTGLYRGFAEPKGVAVVCLDCSGTGCREIKYEPFSERKPQNDVQTVRLSKGASILNCGPTGRSVSYEEFACGKLPAAK